MGLSGDISTFPRLKKAMAEMPTVVAQRVAAKGAPHLTRLAATAYDQGKTVYGDNRPLGVDGQKLDLKKSGRTRGDMKFTSTGTVMRAVLGEKYAPYLVGRYAVLPKGGIPRTWQGDLQDIAAQEVQAHFEQVEAVGGGR